MVTAGYRPNATERAQLAGFYNQPGFQVLQNIFESQIAQLQLDMINEDPVQEKKVLAKHNLAKAAAVFYQRVIDLINDEIRNHVAIEEGTKVQPDLTAELLQD